MSREPYNNIKGIQGNDVERVLLCICIINEINKMQISNRILNFIRLCLF